MFLGKRKNNQVSSFLEPLPKRFKYSVLDYFFELERTLKRFKIKHDKDCKLDLKVINNKVVSTLIIDNERINPYFLDFY